MFDEITSILERVAAHHHTSSDAVRAEIAAALAESRADAELTPEEFIAFAAVTACLSLPEAARN